MKCLSLTNPFGPLIVLGKKSVETRGWKTHWRGQLAIHASKGFPGEAKRFCESRMVCQALGWQECPSPLTQEWLDDMKHKIKALPLGCVIGTVNLVDCVRVESIREKLPEQELAFGNYDDGRYAWILEDPKPLPHIPAKGALGLWEFAIARSE